jgi:hypothetical protein
VTVRRNISRLNLSPNRNQNYRNPSSMMVHHIEEKVLAAAAAAEASAARVDILRKIDEITTATKTNGVVVEEEVEAVLMTIAVEVVDKEDLTVAAEEEAIEEVQLDPKASPMIETIVVAAAVLVIGSKWPKPHQEFLWVCFNLGDVTDLVDRFSSFLNMRRRR